MLHTTCACFKIFFTSIEHAEFHNNHKISFQLLKTLIGRSKEYYLPRILKKYIKLKIHLIYSVLQIEYHLKNLSGR